jgi:hypothetical protein
LEATGLKVYGEGEWKVRIHGVGKRRTWPKIHWGVDERTGHIDALYFTKNNVRDSRVVEERLNHVDRPIVHVSADGAYEDFKTLEERRSRGIKASIPLRKDAKIRQPKQKDLLSLLREDRLREQRALGRKRCKEESGYHRRSLAETAMDPLKQLTGDRLSARIFDTQRTEVRIRCHILNRLNTNTLLSG